MRGNKRLFHKPEGPIRGRRTVMRLYMSNTTIRNTGFTVDSALKVLNKTCEWGVEVSIFISH